MWGDSVFAEPTSSYNQPVPPVQTDPDADPIVLIPLNKSYIPYLMGAAQQLLLQAAYPQDITPDQLNLVQARWMDAINAIGNATAAPIEAPGLGCCEGDNMGCCLRFQNGVLQMYCCGTWQDVPGQPPGGINQPGQPGAGTPQPSPGGGQECYQAVNQPASNGWFLPTTVSTGDVLALSGATGAANDSFNALWYCPDGGQFFLGQNVGYPVMNGADPAPLLAHLRLLYVIEGSYYDAMNGPFTVPSGISGAAVLVVPNSADPTSLQGSYSYQVCVTNNATASWTHTFDFTVSPGIFANALPGTDGGTWQAGTGWVSSVVPATGAEGCTILGTFTNSTITSVTIYYYTNGTVGSGGRTLNVGSNANALQTGDGHHIDTFVTPTNPCNGIYCDCSFAPPNTGQLSVISKLIVNGTGTNPF